MGNTKLTIVIPTFNRPEYLIRNLTFLKHQGCNYNIRVLDGSNSNNQEKNKFICNQFSNVNHQGYPSGLHQGLRFKEGFSTINSKYSLIIADDDFFILHGIEHCIEFLEKNEDYSSAIGKTLSLYRNTKMGINFFAFAQDLSKTYSQNAVNPLRRIIMNDCMTIIGYPPVYYSVKKTEVFKEIYTYPHQELKLVSLEHIGNLITLYRGKHKVLDTLTHIRDYDCPPILEAIRDDQKTYTTQSDMDYLKERFLETLKQEKRFPNDVAEYFAGNVFHSNVSTWYQETYENLMQNQKAKELNKLFKIYQYFYYKVFYRFFPDRVNKLRTKEIVDLNIALKKSSKFLKASF